MRKFLQNVSILFFIVIGLFGLLEITARSVPNSYKYKEEWMQSNAHRVKTLILGSSHAYAAINPSLLDSAFCLANSSQRLEYDYYLLKRYSGKCSNLKNVILTIDSYNMFLPQYEDGATDWNRAIYYHIYMGDKKHSAFSKYFYEIGCNTLLLQKLKSFAQMVILGHLDQQCDSLGFGNYYKLEKKKAKGMTFEYAMSLWKNVCMESLEYNASFLDSIANYCNNNGIRLIAITPPFYKSFRDLELDNRTTIYNDSIIKLVKSYPNCSFYDYSADCRFVEDDFYNVNHLSDKGAKKFTNYIVKETSIR